MLIPHDLKATSSLSTDSLPKDIIVATRTAIGTVRASMKGRLRLNTDIIAEISNLLSIIRLSSSISLSSRNTKVRTSNETRNGFVFSLSM